MTHVVEAAPAEKVERSEPASVPAPGRDRGRAAAPLLTCLLVAALAQLPVLRPGWFYFADDAATQILPMWYHLGNQVRDGVWPPLLDPDLLMGGNLAAETLFGIWSPVNALVWVGVSFSSDVGVAGLVVRTAALALIALGCYLLCRHYGAARWSASALATALPLTGSLLHFDTAKWPAALLAFVWVPFVWLLASRVVRGGTNGFLLFLVGVLAVTAGNPYGLLGVCAVLAAVLVEAALQRKWAQAARLTLVSVAIGAVVPLVYLPLVRTAHMTWRTTSGGVDNTGTLEPHLDDLLNLSMPTYVPDIEGVGVPAVYLCWFVLPLAFWCDWSVLRRRARELAAPALIAAFYLVVALGPAEVWMFRWPLRVVHYGYLALAVLLAVVLTAGLRTDRPRVRAAGTATFLLVSVFFAVDRSPDLVTLKRTVAITVLIGLLIAAGVALHRRRGSRALLAVLQVGTALVFCAQCVWFIGGGPVERSLFPTSPEQMRENYAGRYEGRVLQIGHSSLNEEGAEEAPREVWRDMVIGNSFLLSDVDSVGSYSGIGYMPISDELCMNYHGSTCPEAYDALWRTPRGATVPLADLMLLDTVVVQRASVPQPAVPQGWHLAERNDRVSVLRRDVPASAGTGYLSWASPHLQVRSDTSSGPRAEAVEVHRASGAPGRLVFARSAWPGYTATLNGVRVPAHAGPGGMLEVVLPAGHTGAGRVEITWTPPSLRLGLVSLAGGALLAAGVGLHQVISRRRDTTGAAR
ncbi:hypothetical protein EIL87_12600 [Saccharopolyspora rhizosphaerae]|uniref:YfhO family protein n=1 Tax=Saccharopolyspora rhizosphaerae TaxID=2492662 RepID=A0A3R8NZI7_9PSEU|nr:hypothetical protein [Saccharopolyspora rhizosphaerae]RRO16658.1 hypothetical protein EIL87_12600 [Saccharopolyspora rhizosphaerae]